METLAPTASPNSTQEVFRRWYLALVAVGLILTAVQAIYVPQPSPEASWIIGGLYLTAYVLYSLAPLTAVYTTRATSGLVLLLITVWITTGPLSAVLVMLIGTLLALILQHRVNDQPPRPDLARRVALEVAILAVCTALPAIVFTWLGGLTEQSGPILVQGFLLVILMGAALVLHTAVRAAVWRTVAPGDYTKRLVTWMQSSQILINLQAVILLTLLTISYYLTPWDIFSALFMMMFLAFLIIRATLVTQRELNQQVDELSSLHDGLVSINRVSNIVNASLEYSSIMEQVCTIARQLSGAASVCAFLQAEPGQPYKLIFWSGLAAEFRGALADSLPATSERWQALLTHPEGAAIPEIGADPQTAWLTPLLAGSGIQAMTVIPYVSIRNIVSLRELVPARDVIGFQALFFNERHLPGKNERHLLQMLANQAAVAIENTHLFNETQETVRRLAYLSETSRIFSSSLAMDEITQSVVNWTVDVLDFDTATLALWDAEAGVLDVQAHAVNKAIEAIPVPDIQKPLSRLPEIADVLKRPWSQVFKASETGLSPDMRA
ncbi:MAG: GAF domain-containing protein, partial [Anaerolineae bacterium]|nr:GAF domain-containing protein [Anaerolineae bacterium]